MKIENYRLLLPLLGLFVVCIFIMFGITFIILYITLNEEKESNVTTSSIYQYYELNPSNNISNSGSGIIRINEDISEEGYISYYNTETSSTVIISNFIDNQYECTGSCYCNEDNKRRNSMNMVNKGLYVILFAITATMASKIATETFQNTCEEKLDGVCEHRNVKSEISDCKELMVVNKEHTESTVEEHMERTYFCLGYCLENKDNLFHDTTKSDKERNGVGIAEARLLFSDVFGSCSKLEYSNYVKVEISPDRIGGSNTLAKKKFRTTHLNVFCRSQSLLNVKVRTGGGPKMYFRDAKTAACVSSDSNYNNIKCRLVETDYLLMISNQKK